jgi:hypothetical protein
MPGQFGYTCAPQYVVKWAYYSQVWAAEQEAASAAPSGISATPSERYRGSDRARRYVEAKLERRRRAEEKKAAAAARAALRVHTPAVSST